MARTTDSDARDLEPGEMVYDQGGQLLGRVTGVTATGYEIELLDPDEVDPEEIPGQEFGEGYLMWRCNDCGEMGQLDDGMPETCPDCGAAKEELSEVRED